MRPLPPGRRPAVSSDDDFTIDEAIAFGQGRWSEVPLHKCEGGHEEIKGVARQLADEIERLRAALRYIERPTMSLPGGANAEQHALIADERAVRLALQTCIRTAREALSNGSADATEVGGPS